MLGAGEVTIQFSTKTFEILLPNTTLTSAPLIALVMLQTEIWLIDLMLLAEVVECEVQLSPSESQTGESVKS